MKSMLFGAIVALCFFATNAVFAGGNATAGKTKSSACQGCHGLNGKSNNPKVPNLAGQKEIYLVSAINSYKNGKRNDPMMKTSVGALSDADIADLAAFYSSVK